MKIPETVQHFIYRIYGRPTDSGYSMDDEFTLGAEDMFEALCDPRCEGSAEVLAEIQRQREAAVKKAA